MNIDQIIKTDLSGTTYRSVKERRREFKKNIPNTTLVKTTRDSIYYKSRSTINPKKHYEVIVKTNRANDIFVYCSCEAFLYQGFAYRANMLRCGIKNEKREDNYWKRFHGKSSVLCKHLWILFHKDKKKLQNVLKTLKK